MAPLTPQDAQQILDAFLQFMWAVVPIILAFLGKVAYDWMSTNATQANNRHMLQVGFTICQAVEQYYRSESGATRFMQADQWLKMLVPALNDAERRIIIETCVKAINAGAVQLAPAANLFPGLPGMPPLPTPPAPSPIAPKPVTPAAPAAPVEPAPVLPPPPPAAPVVEGKGGKGDVAAAPRGTRAKVSAGKVVIIPGEPTREV